MIARTPFCVNIGCIPPEALPAQMWLFRASSTGL
jgi:hypothetical protein